MFFFFVFWRCSGSKKVLLVVEVMRFVKVRRGRKISYILVKK